MFETTFFVQWSWNFNSFCCSPKVKAAFWDAAETYFFFVLLPTYCIILWRWYLCHWKKMTTNRNHYFHLKLTSKQFLKKKKSATVFWQILEWHLGMGTIFCRQLYRISFKVFLYGTMSCVTQSNWWPVVDQALGCI